MPLLAQNVFVAQCLIRHTDLFTFCLYGKECLVDDGPYRPTIGGADIASLLRGICKSICVVNWLKRINFELTCNDNCS